MADTAIKSRFEEREGFPARQAAHQLRAAISQRCRGCGRTREVERCAGMDKRADRLHVKLPFECSAQRANAAVMRPRIDALWLSSQPGTMSVDRTSFMTRSGWMPKPIAEIGRKVRAAVITTPSGISKVRALGKCVARNASTICSSV